MPRKTRACSRGWRRRAGFNEAAARCRGKPNWEILFGQCRSSASMRPRPDAAENKYQIFFYDKNIKASMRPRPDAAENALKSYIGARLTLRLQ